MLPLKAGIVSKKVIRSGASLCFLFISVYILRAVRDEMAVQVGVYALSWLISLSFVLLILFSITFSTTQRSSSYLFRVFVLGLCVLFASVVLLPGGFSASILFVTIGCGNLLLISQFWRGIADYFHKTEVKAAYPQIMLIGSLGVLLGPLFVTVLAQQSVSLLLLTGCFFLGLSAGITKPLMQKPQGDLPSRYQTSSDKPTRQWPIAGFVLTYSILATVLYGEQIATVERFSLSQEERIHFFGKRDLWIGLITLALQWFGQRLRHSGIRWVGLQLLPILSFTLFLIIGWHNSLETILWSFVLFRSFNYAYARPARELYFSGMAGRFNFKSFIDTVVYRAGDLVGIWLFQLLTGWQLDYLQIATILLPLIGLWILFTKRIVKTLNA